MKKAAMPKLAVSIVSYNTRADLAACLESVFASETNAQVEVIVVDNGSTDGSREMARESYPQAVLIESPQNLGYGLANNLALLGRPADYYLIANSDIVLEKSAIERLIQTLSDSPATGIAMGALLNPDGSYQTTWAAGELTVESILWEQSFLARLFPASRLFGDYFRTWWDHSGACSLPQACGALMMIRADLYNRLGGFAPEFFMYCEDTDLSRRARLAGYKIAYVPEARALHGHGRSSEGSLRPGMISEHNRSRYVYLLKFAGPRRAETARRIMIGGAVARVLLWGALGLVKPSAKTRARGFLDVLRQTLGMR